MVKESEYGSKNCHGKQEMRQDYKNTEPIFFPQDSYPYLKYTGSLSVWDLRSVFYLLNKYGAEDPDLTPQV